MAKITVESEDLIQVLRGITQGNVQEFLAAQEFRIQTGEHSSLKSLYEQWAKETLGEKHNPNVIVSEIEETE